MSSSSTTLPTSSSLGTADRSVIEIAVDLASQEFIKGFIAGQLTLLILLATLVKFFFFRGNAETRLEKFASPSTQAQVKFTKNIETDQELFLRFEGSSAAQLSSTENNVQANISAMNSDTASQSAVNIAGLEWLHFAIAKTIQFYKSSPDFQRKMIDKLENSLGSKPSFLSKIHILNVTISDGFPLLSRFEVSPSTMGNGLAIQCMFDWNDSFEVSMETSYIVEWPQTTSMSSLSVIAVSLPISLTLSLTRLKGTAVFDLDKEKGTVMASFLNDLEVDFDVKSLVGHKTKLKDIPKVTSLIVNAMRSTLERKVVLPNGFTFKL